MSGIAGRRTAMVREDHRLVRYVSQGRSDHLPSPGGHSYLRRYAHSRRKKCFIAISNAAMTSSIPITDRRPESSRPTLVLRRFLTRAPYPAKTNAAAVDARKELELAHDLWRSRYLPS